MYHGAGLSRIYCAMPLDKWYFKPERLLSYWRVALKEDFFSTTWYYQSDRQIRDILSVRRIGSMRVKKGRNKKCSFLNESYKLQGAIERINECWQRQLGWMILNSCPGRVLAAPQVTPSASRDAGRRCESYPSSNWVGMPSYLYILAQWFEQPRWCAYL